MTLKPLILGAVGLLALLLVAGAGYFSLRAGERQASCRRKNVGAGRADYPPGKWIDQDVLEGFSDDPDNASFFLAQSDGAHEMALKKVVRVIEDFCPFARLRKIDVGH